MVKQDGAKIHNFLCFNLASAISTGEPFLDYLPFQRGAVVAKELPLYCFSVEDLWFHVTLSTGCSVHFQHKFNYNYDPINIWKE